jgi:hypothetical protein
MKLKSLIRGVVGLLTVAFLAGCEPPYSGPWISYVNPLTGLAQPTPPKPSEVASANNNPNSFARANPSYDFTSTHTWTIVSDVRQNFPDGTNPPGTSPSRASSSGPSGAVEVTAPPTVVTPPTLLPPPPPAPPPVQIQQPKVF